MKDLLKRIGIGKEAAAELDLSQEARHSFLLCQSDNYLARAFFEREHQLTEAAFLANMSALVNLDASDRHSLATELNLLKSCLSTYQQVFDKELFVSLMEGVCAELLVPVLILFPLVLNALQQGYNSMEDRPLKIQISKLGEGLQLTVSNRVNHYLRSQEDTLMMDLFKKRLQHCYPDKHSLLCNSNSATFKATLQLLP